MKEKSTGKSRSYVTVHLKKSSRVKNATMFPV